MINTESVPQLSWRKIQGISGVIILLLVNYAVKGACGSIVECSSRERKVPSSSLRRGSGDVVGLQASITLSVYSVHSFNVFLVLKSQPKALQSLCSLFIIMPTMNKS